MRAAALAIVSLAGACALPAAELVSSQCTGVAHSDGEALYARCSPETSPQVRRLDADGAERWSVDLDARQLATPPGDELIAIDRQAIVAIAKATGAIREVHRILDGEVEAVALAGSMIYWIQQVGVMWTIQRVPLAGGIATRVVTAPQRLSSLGVDDEAVYWLDDEGTGSALRRLEFATDEVTELARFNNPSARQPLLMAADSIFVETGPSLTVTLDVHRLRRPLLEGTNIVMYARGSMAATDRYLLLGNSRFDLAANTGATLFGDRFGPAFYTIAALDEYVYWNDLDGLWRWPIEREGVFFAEPDESGPPLVSHPF